VHDGVFGDVTVAFLRLVVLLGDGDVVDYARIDGISIGMSESPRLFSPERAARDCRDFLLAKHFTKQMPSFADEDLTSD
jgi:hypothetical protein